MPDSISLFTDETHLISSDSMRRWKDAALTWLFNYDSKHTRANYRRAIDDFFQTIKLHPQMVTQKEVLRFRYLLEQRDYSQATINQRLAALSSFYNHAVESNLREENPCDGVKRKRVNPYGKSTFLEDDQDKLLLQQVDRRTSRGKRDYAILLLFLTTAVRVDAVANLVLGDFRQQGNSIYMSYINKGGESVEKRLQPVVIQAMIDYLDTRPSDLYDDSPMFIAAERGRRRYANDGMDAMPPLSARSIQRMVKRYADAAFGGNHGITPHSLRHTAAMNAMQSGASAIEVSRLLRHKNMQVTTIYIQHVSDKADEAISETLAQRYDD